MKNYIKISCQLKQNWEEEHIKEEQEETGEPGVNGQRSQEDFD